MSKLDNLAKGLGAENHEISLTPTKKQINTTFAMSMKRLRKNILTEKEKNEALIAFSEQIVWWESVVKFVLEKNKNPQNRYWLTLTMMISIREDLDLEDPKQPVSDSRNIDISYKSAENNNRFVIGTSVGILQVDLSKWTLQFRK